MVLFHLVIQIAFGYFKRLRGLGFVPAIKLQRPFDRLHSRLIPNGLQRLISPDSMIIGIHLSEDVRDLHPLECAHGAQTIRDRVNTVLGNFV